MQSPTVFVVADEPSVLDVLTKLFKQAKLHCETFATAEVFLAEFDPKRPGCMLLDMSVEPYLHRMLVQRQSIIPVIILTSMNDARSAMDAIKGGALDFFEKPFDSETLLEAVKHAIQMDDANRHALRLRAEVRYRFTQLTRREREIIGGMLGSKSCREIAVQLHMSTRTVEFHRAKIMKKMGIVSLVELVRLDAMAFGCHCIHKHKYSQGEIASSNIFPLFFG